MDDFSTLHVGHPIRNFWCHLEDLAVWGSFQIALVSWSWKKQNYIWVTAPQEFWCLACGSSRNFQDHHFPWIPSEQGQVETWSPFRSTSPHVLFWEEETSKQKSTFAHLHPSMVDASRRNSIRSLRPASLCKDFTAHWVKEPSWCILVNINS